MAKPGPHPKRNQAIVSFQHCDPATHILCFNAVLPVCPLCRGRLDDGLIPLPAPPVRLPSVLVNATTRPHSLAVKPTQGTFLQTYTPGSFLHVGITGSSGTVYNYDEEGIHRDRASWEQAVIIPLLGRHDYEMKADWDAELHSFSESAAWQAESYHDDTNNCLDFVVAFLNHTRYNQTVRGLAAPLTRDVLCADFIVTVTASAAERMRVHRMITENGYAIQKQPVR